MKPDKAAEVARRARTVAEIVQDVADNLGTESVEQSRAQLERVAQILRLRETPEYREAHAQFLAGEEGISTEELLERIPHLR